MNNIVDKLKNTNTARQFRKAFTFAKKHIKKIKYISIISCIVIVGLNITFVILGIFQSFGRTPHYYCNPHAEYHIKESKMYRQYCSNYGNSIGGNEGIAESAVTLATGDRTIGHNKIEWTTFGMTDIEKYQNTYPVGPFLNITPKIIEIATQLTKNGQRDGKHLWEGNYYASCDLSVSSAVLWSGADDKFPMYLTGTEMKNAETKGITGHLTNNGSDKWVEVPRGEKVLPGDIALGELRDYGYQHVWMYVATWENGKWIDNSIVQKRFPNSTANRYEGSSREYYSVLSRDGNPWQSSHRIFRFVGTIDETSLFKTIGGR